MAIGFLSEIFTSIQGEGPYLGLKQIFIRFSGCSLGCEFCDTKDAWGKSPRFNVHNAHENQLKKVYTNPITPEDTISIIQNIIKKETYIHSIFLTGGEPLEQPEYFKELVIGLKKSKLNVYLETNTINFETLREVIDYIDIISADIKILHPKFKNILSESLWKFLKIPPKDVLFLKIPVNNKLKPSYFHETIRKISSIRNDTPVIIQPIYEELLPEPSEKFIGLLFELQKIASNYFNDVRIIPQIHKLLKIK